MGSNYYAQFTNGPSTPPFPIGVWLACAHDAAAVQNDKAVGIKPVRRALCERSGAHDNMSRTPT